MSNFESTALSTDSTSSDLAGSTPAASSAAAAGGSGGITSGESSATTAPGGDSTPLTAEETAAVFSEQPTGDVPTAEEMEDRKDATSSADNLLPTDKLQNGLKNAKLMFASGWASVAATYRDLERTETAEKLKEGTVAMIDKSMDGLSKVGCKISETTERGVQVVGAKMEEAAPTLGRWRDEVVIASERGMEAVKDMTDRAISWNRPGENNGGGAPGASGSGGDSGAAADGPHTV
eukprot:g17636.t1